MYPRTGNLVKYPLNGRHVPALVLRNGYEEGVPCIKVRVIPEKVAKKLGV